MQGIKEGKTAFFCMLVCWVERWRDKIALVMVRKGEIMVKVSYQPVRKDFWSGKDGYRD